MAIAERLIRLGKVDRRIIFLAIGLTVFLPLIFTIGLPVIPTETTKKAFDTVENLPSGSRVLLSAEYGPSTKPEIHPMTMAVLRHLFRKQCKVYVTCLWPDGQFMAKEALTEVAEGEFGLSYGKDFVLLGFRPGNEAVVKGIVSDIRYIFTVDYQNTLIDSIPMMSGIRKLKDFALVISMSAGYPGTVEWIQYGSDPTGVPITTGTASIQVNEVLPYVAAGQLQGIIAGMPGAAEYEAMIGRKGFGYAGMDAQSVAHLVIVFFIIVGNLTYLLERRRAKSGGR